MQVIQTVAPINEPITLEEVKAFASAYEDDHDSLLTSFISTARESTENYLNRQIATATFELLIDGFFQDMRMPKGHIQSIEKIEYMVEDGSYEIFDSNYYYLYGDNDVFNIHYDATCFHKYHKQAIKITFIAGYTIVPMAIKTYLKHIVSTMYENREKFVVGVSVSDIVGSMYINLISNYRIQSL